MPEITERVTAAVAGRYRIERHIGEGGMATVYLARDLKQYSLYEVGLDDSRFMMMRAVESSSAPATRPEVVLVENWDEALRQQTGN